MTTATTSSMLIEHAAAVAEPAQALGDIVLEREALRSMQEVELIDLLLQVRTARQNLALAERELEGAAARAMTGDRVAVQGKWIAERRWGKDRTKWENDDLAREVVKRAIDTARVDTSTGELIEPNATTWAVRDALLACARPSWRVTALRELDINPDEYCSSEKARPTVQVVASEGGEA